MICMKNYYYELMMPSYNFMMTIAFVCAENYKQQVKHIMNIITTNLAMFSLKRQWFWKQIQSLHMYHRSYKLGEFPKWDYHHLIFRRTTSIYSMSILKLILKMKSISNQFLSLRFNIIKAKWSHEIDVIFEAIENEYNTSNNEHHAVHILMKNKMQ